MNKYDYTGKTIFVGLDVHKKTYNVVALLDGELIKRDRISACPEVLVAYLKKFFAGATIFSAYEAGFSGFVLHRFLLDNDIENIVVHPAAIEISSRDRVKTDKRDALKIATQLSVGRLKCIPIPSPEREDYREVTRFRDSLVRDRSKIANQIKSIAHRYGQIAPNDSSVVSAKWLKKLMTDSSLNQNAKLRIEYLIEEWHKKTSKIKDQRC